MNGKKKLVFVVAVAVIVVVAAVCVWWIFPGDQRPVKMSAKELERYWLYAAELNKETTEDPHIYPDGVEVYAEWYSDGTLAHASIYDPKNDTCYDMYAATEGYKYTRFRHGSPGSRFYPPER